MALRQSPLMQCGNTLMNGGVAKVSWVAAAAAERERPVVGGKDGQPSRPKRLASPVSPSVDQVKSSWSGQQLIDRGQIPGFRIFDRQDFVVSLAELGISARWRRRRYGRVAGPIGGLEILSRCRTLRASLRSGPSSVRRKSDRVSQSNLNRVVAQPRRTRCDINRAKIAVRRDIAR